MNTARRLNRRLVRAAAAALVAFFALLALFQSATGAMAQETEPPPPPDVIEAPQQDGVFVAPVVIDGETLFLVRGSSALPASERAANVEKRIIAAAEASESKRVSVTIRKSEFGLSILADERLMTVATSADAELEQMDQGVVAALQSEAIELAILRYREERSDEARVDSALVAIGWSLGFILVSVLFFRQRQRVAQIAAEFTERRFGQLERATNSVVQGKAIARLVGYAVHMVLWIIYLFLLYYYLSFVMLSFAETRPLAQILLTYVSEPMVDIIRGFISYIPNFITLIIIALVTRYIIRGFQLVMENVEAGTFELQNFERHWIKPTFNIARALAILVAIVFAYPYIPGSDSKAFQGLTIIAGLMISLGSNTVVSNMMAGLFVIYRRSTNIGDRIKVGDQIGDVVEIKLMETLIKSIKNEMVSIPNAQLLNSEVVNYSRKIDGRGLLVHTTVSIGYEEPQEKIEAMLIEAAHRTAGLRKSPDPFVLFTALGDFAINYQINAFSTRGSSLPKLVSDLHRNIVAVFNENNVQIMTPSYESDPDQPKIPSETWSGELAKSKTP